jgi:cell division protein FtsQ
MSLANSIPQRDESPRRIARRRVRWVVVSVAAMVGVGALLGVSRTSAFHARGIEVTGASTLSRAQVVRASGLDLRTNVLWLDEGEVERRLEAEPWIAHSDVSVAFPFSIEIAVVERVPVAIATDGVSSVLIASDGTALGQPRSETGRGMPVIEFATSGQREGAPGGLVGAALALGAMEQGTRDGVSRVSVLLDGTLEVWMRSGSVIRYGSPSGFDAKARAIAHAFAWASSEGEEIVSLSVVAPSAPAATLAP